MSDEQAFLDALALALDDDLTRLVYADWLDDHRDARADYLRREVEWASLADYDERRGPLAEQLREARRSIEPGWLARAGKRFDVVFFGCAPDRRIPLVKVHRELTRVSLLEAKWATGLLPSCLGLALPLDEAERLSERYLGPLGDIDLALLPSAHAAAGYAAFFVADHPTTSFLAPEQLTAEVVREREEARRRVADLLGIRPAVLETHDLRASPLSLGEGLDLAKAMAIHRAGGDYTRILVRRLPAVPEWPEGLPPPPGHRGEDRPYELVLEGFEPSARRLVARALRCLGTSLPEGAEDGWLDRLPLVVPAGPWQRAVWVWRRFRGQARARVVPRA